MNRSSYSRRHQQGVALAVALVLLLVMSVLGVASLRTSLMEERMSGALLDRGLAFQAAEGGLREGESLLVGATLPVFPGAGCEDGLCARPQPAAGVPDRWNDAAFEGWRAVPALGTGLALAPEFFVEDMGPAPNWPGCEQEVPVNALCLSPRFRVTARSGDASSGRAQTLLQSNFATP